MSIEKIIMRQIKYSNEDVTKETKRRRQFLVKNFVVEGDFKDKEGFSTRNPPTMSCIPMKDPTSFRYKLATQRLKRDEAYKFPTQKMISLTFFSNSLANLLIHFWKLFIYHSAMEDGIRRALQEINLGFNDASFAYPRKWSNKCERKTVLSWWGDWLYA
ncbi:hypothetical protein YC2023_089752 [Brassica napus]